jgi:hypothetical protein
MALSVVSSGKHQVLTFLNLKGHLLQHCYPFIFKALKVLLEDHDVWKLRATNEK